MKSIVVFSDGTGNSSAKFFKTNVWRLYQAIDTSEPQPGNDAIRQIVDYDSGVGTSSFKPLALLGGAFGVGLRRNVLDLYQFICRNYEPGDRIYAFGFSRGAFTIRVLVGLIASIGLVRASDRVILNALTEDAYREFRRCFRLSGNRVMNGAAAKKRRDLTDLVVEPLRNWRDRRINRKRQRAGLPVLGEEHKVPVNGITFVGVWDTVAAYGSPIAEITKGIDKWIWPLSMPDYKLSVKVQCARHALALDDERDTFHPLLWDEVHERALVRNGEVDEARLRQVWFAGMHSDVGGGYADDALSYVSLVWMAEEAERVGLRLTPGALDGFRRAANVHGPIHDSRSGVGAYYRYQPRKISARLERPDPTTLLQQDPDMKGRGLLTDVRIHASVLERIFHGTDFYAPFVLPATYEVVGGPARERHGAQRAAAQERVWDDVWRRRINYFVTLIITLWLLLFPILLPLPAESCVGPQCIVSPLISYVGGWLPDFTSQWFAGYAARPGTFLITALVTFLLMRRASKLELSMRDRMHRLHLLSTSADANAPAAISAEGGKPGVVRTLRRSSGYQKTLRAVKWNIGPALAASFIGLGCLLLLVSVLGFGAGGAHRAHMMWAERALAYCSTAISQQPGDDAALFNADSMCSRMPFTVQKGQRYRLRLTVSQPWFDKSIYTSPEGFGSERFGWPLRVFAPLLRRSFSDPWFRPLVTVVTERSEFGGMTAVPMRLSDLDGHLYLGHFEAPATGAVMLSVNDAVFLWGGDSAYFYRGHEDLNAGTASVQFEDCSREPAVPCD